MSISMRTPETAPRKHVATMGLDMRLDTASDLEKIRLARVRESNKTQARLQRARQRVLLSALKTLNLK